VKIQFLLRKGLLMTGIKPAYFLLSLIFLPGCALVDALHESKQLSNQQIRVNSILDVRTGKLINEAQLYQRVLASEYLLLGETHDNSYHHELQARIIKMLRHQPQRSISVSFEMITRKQAELLNQQNYDTSKQLIDILDRVKNNWPYQRDYQIVFDSVITAGFEILPANLDLDTLIQISMQPDEILPPDVRQLLEKTPLSESQYTDLEKEIIYSHCNKLPSEAISPMMQVQRVRDAVMALSLLRSKAETRVLIAGAGHTRNDRGVPLYLRGHDNTVNILSLAYLDVEPDTTDMQAYTQRWGGKTLPFDYVWFTPAVQRTEDPCNAIKHRKKTEKDL